MDKFLLDDFGHNWNSSLLHPKKQTFATIGSQIYSIQLQSESIDYRGNSFMPEEPPKIQIYLWDLKVNLPWRLVRSIDGHACEGLKKGVSTEANCFKIIIRYEPS